MANDHNWILTCSNSAGLVAWKRHLGAITKAEATKAWKTAIRVGWNGLSYTLEKTEEPYQPFKGWKPHHGIISYYETHAI